MIAKKYKLPIDEFPRSSRLAYRGELFSLRAAPNGKGFNRVGVVAKSTFFKTAVLRNRLKRAAFDAIAEFTKSVPLPQKGTDLLITLNQPIISLTREEMIKTLKHHVSAI